nr:hypothetical protein [Pararhizobium arenae]
MVEDGRTVSDDVALDRELTIDQHQHDGLMRRRQRPVYDGDLDGEDASGHHAEPVTCTANIAAG